MKCSCPNCDFLPKWITFGPDEFVLVMTISFWLWPNHYGQVQINLVRPKLFLTDQNCFGLIEGKGINFHFIFLGRWDSFNGKIRRVTASPSLIPFLKTKLSSHRPTILNYNTLSAINRIYTYKRMRKILAELIDKKSRPFFSMHT